MTKKQKLELTWIGKENRPRLEPRILLQDLEKSYHAPHRVTEKDIFDNKLIHGDNLLALWLKETRQKKRTTFSDHPIAIERSWLQVGLPAARINLNYNRKTFQPQSTPRAQSKNDSLCSLWALWLNLRAVEQP